MTLETPTSFDEATITALRERSRRDLYFFAKGVLGFDKLVPSVHMPICRLLENLANTRLLICLPRSWYKSTLVSIAYPIWRVLSDPDLRIAIVQNSHSNAIKKLAVIRGKFESCAVFRALFPELLPTKDCTWSNDSLQVPRKTQNAEGTFEAAGTRTKLTSRHYDVIIEDDTVAPDLDDLSDGVILPSREDVEQAIGWHRLAMPLLNSPGTSQIIIVGTRWFERDLISWNIENEPRYLRYMRAVRETNGLADEEGELTFPEQFGDTVLQDLANALGKYMYSCLYMNKPLRSGDMIFQPEWFKYYETAPREMVCYTTVDLAGDPAETKGDPDYNVVMTTGKDLVNGGIFVLEYFRKRCSPSEIIQSIFDHVRRHSPVRVGIESVQYQLSLIHWIKERMQKEDLYFLIEPVTHGKRSKNSRIQGLQPLVQSGTLRFRTHHRELVSELVAFPLAQYDDLGDALATQIPMWAITRSRSEERRPDPANDPWTLDHAQKELRGRVKERAKNSHAWANIQGQW